MPRKFNGGCLLLAAASVFSALAGTCAEDGNVCLWDLHKTTRGANALNSSCAFPVHTKPLAVLRLDHPQQQPQLQLHTDAGVLGQQPGVAAEAGKAIAAGQGGPAQVVEAALGLNLDLLSGVAEDADAPQSRCEYRAHEVHCVAAGRGLPPGCLLAGTGGWADEPGRVGLSLGCVVDAVRSGSFEAGVGCRECRSTVQPCSRWLPD